MDSIWFVSIKMIWQNITGRIGAICEGFAQIDFTKVGKVKPCFHCAIATPAIVNRNPIYENAIRSLNLIATHTHVWTLVNNGQRVIDTHFVFPLLQLDAKEA